MVLDKKRLKEKLDQLYDIRKEISEITNKVNKLEPEALVKDYVYKSSKYFPYTKHKVTLIAENPRLLKKVKYLIDSNLPKKVEEYKNILTTKTCKLLEVEVECENFISQLPTSRLRRIFRYRYFEQYSWRKIAYLIGGNATEDSVKKEHNRYMQKE